MGGGFYKIDNEVLKLDIKKHKDEILFNHYLMQKENLQRLKGGLPKGQFYLSRHDVAINLEVSPTKAQRLITKFIKKNIISQIRKGINQEELSIYKYVEVDGKSGQACGQASEQASGQAEHSNLNGLEDINEQASGQVSGQASGQYKKEILKRNIKNNIYISKDIYVSTDVDLVIEKWNSLNLSKIVNIKGNRLKMLNARIKEYEIGGILTAIKNIEKSNFLKGQNNKNWIITFDWFIRPNNFIKVLEGNYTNRKEKPQHEANRVLERVYE